VTFSLVARCPHTGQFGVGAVTGTPGVGKLLTWARRRTGAIATQAWINPYLGIDALALLEHGHPAEKALAAVIAMDEGRDLRQVAVVDDASRTAVWTGGDCSPWAGERTGEGWAAIGNLLASGDTLDACVARYAELASEPLVERLLGALEAGEAAGGDSRGARSATVYVVDSEEYPLWDVRIDDHGSPLPELRRVKERFAEELIPQIQKLPTRENTVGDLTQGSHDGLV
jgi:uncharacterized Ntn-hydrolase superfamily protein